MTARDELAAALHSEGAYCGNCGFDGLALCSDCRTVLGRYADRLIGDGWVKMPSREALARVYWRHLGYDYDLHGKDGNRDCSDGFELADAILVLLAGETS